MTYKKVLVLLLGILIVILVTNCVNNEKDVVGKSFDTLTSYQKQKYWQCMEKDCNGLLLSKQYPAYRQCALNCMNSAENTLEQQAWCKDSDGIDYFSKGIVTTDVYPQGKEDNCKTFSNGKTYLIEGKCFNNKYSYMQKSCSEAKKGYLCVEGTCVPECVTPPENLDEPWQITENTKLCEGTYSMPKGIEIMKDGVELDCDGAVLSGNDILISKGITIKNRESIKVQNCAFQKFMYGIYLESSDNNEIKDNVLSDNYEEGILVYKSNYNIIKENEIINNVGEETNGIYITESHHNTIEANDILNNKGESAIYIDFSNNNYIKNNNIENNKYYGITVRYSTENEVTGNSILNNYNMGINIGHDAENLLVKNNLIRGSLGGISLFSQGEDTTIEYNTIVENEVGIKVSTLSNNLKIEYNNIYDNTENDLQNNQIELLIIENNYWCTINQEIIANHILGQGFVDFTPFLYEPVEDAPIYPCIIKS